MFTRMRPTVRGRIAWARLLILLAPWGCDSPSEPAGARALDLGPAAASLLVGPGGGDTIRLAATPLGRGGRPLRGRTVLWRSTALAVASVSPTGLVTAVGPGITRIIASVDGVEAQAEIAVGLVPVRSVEFTVDSLRLDVGPSVAEQVQLVVIARDSAGHPLPDRLRFWWAVDSSIAAVDAAGVARARDMGVTRLIASVEGVQDTLPVGVIEVADAWRQVSAGTAHACGVARDSTAYCWGAYPDGRLGIGTPQPVLYARPTRVAGGHRFLEVSAGFRHSCGIAADRAAYCWGENTDGKLGDSTMVTREVPTPVRGGIAFARIEASVTRTCGVSIAQQGWCWGSGGGGTGDSALIVDRWVPRIVAGGAPVAMLALGLAHTCGLAPDGSAWCYGADDFGQLGNGPDGWSLLPSPVAGGHRFERLVSGAYTTCGLKADGTAWCWGWDPTDEYGVVFIDALTEPTLMAGGTRFSDLVIGQGHPFLCGVLAAPSAGGNVVCWGENDQGQLGDGSAAFRAAPAGPVDVGLVRALSAGQYQSCAVGELAWCWGLNSLGSLGDGTGQSSRTPRVVRGRWH